MGTVLGVMGRNDDKTLEVEGSGRKEGRKEVKVEGEYANQSECNGNNSTARQHTLEFPEELLETIFSKVEDMQDVKAISDSCPQFNRILAPSKPVWLFSEVFPHIFPKLDKEDMLNCRLVCKSWTNVVDGFLQTHPITRDQEPYPPTGSSCPSNDRFESEVYRPAPYAPVCQVNLVVKDFAHLVLCSTSQIARLMRTMRGHPTNPFLLRYIEFRCANSGYQAHERFWNAAFNFLARFGQFIWHVSIGPSVEADEEYPTFSYSVLRRALTYLPNLKTLILFDFDTHQESANDMVRKSRLQYYIECFPLPALPCLGKVENMLPDAYSHGPVMNEVLKRYSTQLIELSTDLSFSTENPTRMNLPQLTQLSLRIDEDVQCWKNFCRCVKLPNLRKLNLNVKTEMCVSTLLEPLQKNFPLLEYLKLRFFYLSNNFNNFLMDQSSLAPAFQLGKIKTLEVFDGAHVQYGQIFSHLPRLEYVLLCCDTEIRHSEEVMYQSEIWETKKDLKSVTVARLGRGNAEDEIINKYTYTRQVYNTRKLRKLL